MLRRLRSLIVPVVRLLLLGTWFAWSAWGVGGILSLAVLLWMLWPKGAPPVVPDRLPTAREVRAGTPSVAATRPASQPASRPAPTEKELFDATYFDPEDERLDPRYSHEVKLTKEQLAAVMAQMEELIKLHKTFQDEDDYLQRVDAALRSPAVETALYRRIQSGKGFRQPDLPELWAKFADADGPDFDLIGLLRNNYFLIRLQSIRHAIVRGRATEGDLKFLAYATRTLNEMIAALRARAENVSRLRGLLWREDMHF